MASHTRPHFLIVRFVVTIILGAFALSGFSAGAQSAVAPSVLVVTNTSEVVNGSVKSPAALKKRPGRDGISLTEAMAAATSGTTIEFAPKLATATIAVSALNFIVPGVTLVGTGGTTPGPVIVGPISITASKITLRGLDLRNTEDNQPVVNIAAYGRRAVQNVTLTNDAIAASGLEAHTIVIESDNGGALKNVTVSHNTMTNLPADAIATFLSGTGSTIVGLTISGNTISTVKHVGVEVFGQASTKSTLSNLTISANTFTNMSLAVREPVVFIGWFGGGGGNTNDLVEQTTISGNTMENYGGACIQLGDDGNQPGDSGDIVRDTTIVNDLCAPEAGSGPGLYIAAAGTNGVDGLQIVNDTVNGSFAFIGPVEARILNTILTGWSSQTPVKLDQIQNSLVSGSSVPPGFAGSSGNIAADPRFVDPVQGNYHLRAGSPAIDAGSTAGAPTTDLDGHARSDGRADIGAYEFAG